MKVKKQGINSSTWEMDVSCPYCKAELTICCDDFQREDITIADLILFTSISRKFIIECSECGEEIEIPARKVPSIIKEALDKEYEHHYIIKM